MGRIRGWLWVYWDEGGDDNEDKDECYCRQECVSSLPDFVLSPFCLCFLFLDGPPTFNSIVLVLGPTTYVRLPQPEKRLARVTT